MAESALRDIFQPRPAQENQETPYIDLLRQNKDKDFVNRILNPGIAPAGIPWEGDSTASHQMAAEVDDKGNWYVFPRIVNRGGKLEAMPLYDAMDEAIKTGEYIPMPDEQSAVDLSMNYKSKAMQDFFTRPVYRPQAQAQPSSSSALRALDQAYMMGIGRGPAPERVPRTRGQTAADILGAASLPMSAVPIAGDITGLAADAAMYAAYPEERTMGNYAMSALGVLPLVPGVAAVRAARGASPLEGTLDMSQAARMQKNSQWKETPINSVKPDYFDGVMDANQNYEVFGLRVVPRGFEANLGDRLPVSKDWDEGIDTGIELDGTSAIGLSEGQAERAINQLLDAGYDGDQIVLIGGKNRGYGQDAGEVLIGGAEVLKTFSMPRR